jgi:chemotaxis protein MotB
MGMISKRTLALAVLALPFVTGCVSQEQYHRTLSEREAENRALREERTQLKNQMRDLQYKNESLETALAEANAQLLEAPEPIIVQQEPQRFQAFDDLGIGYGMRNGNMVISIPSEITFPSGKAQLSEQGKNALTVVSRTLIDQYPAAEYWIEGHTDSDPIRKSSFPTNRDLSLARSMAVLHYLVNDTGIPDGQWVVAGWGEYRPVAANDSNTNKSRNRRVEIVVHRQ